MKGGVFFVCFFLLLLWLHLMGSLTECVWDKVFKKWQQCVSWKSCLGCFSFQKGQCSFTSFVMKRMRCPWSDRALAGDRSLDFTPSPGWCLVKVLLTQSCPTLCDPVAYSPARLLCPWDSPGKNTGVGCHSLLQGIFPNQGWNPSLLSLLHWQGGSLPLEPPGKPISGKGTDVKNLQRTKWFGGLGGTLASVSEPMEDLRSLGWILGWARVTLQDPERNKLERVQASSSPKATACPLLS